MIFEAEVNKVISALWKLTRVEIADWWPTHGVVPARGKCWFGSKTFCVFKSFFHVS